jgi:hypothetical protein
VELSMQNVLYDLMNIPTLSLYDLQGHWLYGELIKKAITLWKKSSELLKSMLLLSKLYTSRLKNALTETETYCTIRAQLVE